MRWLKAQGDALALILAWAAAVAWVGPPRGDFANYYTAAALWWEGRIGPWIYDYRAFFAETAAAGFGDQLTGFAVLTPPSALLLAPLLPMGPAGAAKAWMVLQFGMIVGIGLLLARAAGRRPAFGLGLLFLGWPAIEAHLRQGQAHLLAVLCLAAAFVWAGRAGGGLGLGLAVGLKLHAWPLILGQRGRSLGAALGVLVLGAAVSVAALGWPMHATWLGEIGPAAARGWCQDPWTLSFQSVGAALKVMGVGQGALNPDGGGLAPQTVDGLALGFEVLLVGLSLGSPRALSIAALVSGPLLARYHLVSALPALILGLGAAKGRRRWILLGLGLGLFWVPLPDAWGALPLLGARRALFGIGLWAALVEGWSGRRSLGALVVAAGMGLAVARRPGPADDGARPYEDRRLPLILADLELVEEGALRFSGMDREGWRVWGLDPQTDAIFAVGGGPRVQRGAGERRCGTLRLLVVETDGQSDIRWERGLEGGALTANPAQDIDPVCDLARGRVWFLSDRGVGVRAYRLWWAPLPA